MGYIALPRVKILDALKLIGFNEKALEVNLKIIDL